MSIAIGLYIYMVVGLILATAFDRYWMREQIPYAWAPALPLGTLRTWTIIGLTILWPCVFFYAAVTLSKLAWYRFRAYIRARRIYGHRS